MGFALTAIVSYLLGSSPTGYLFAKAKGIDIRTVGSGNIGATNAFRVLGKTVGISVLLIDLLKGFVACRYVAFGPTAPSEAHQMIAGLFAILGHNYTCWLRFKGGKGIATSAGVLLALVPAGFAIAATVFFVVLAMSRYVSLSSIIGAIVLPIGVWLAGGTTSMIALTTFLSLMAIYKHRANIQRLIAGTESRIGQKPKEAK
ncbi:MAG TPA: glycerol-3-phosphate 1-O-acyltransferase PlsY [Verrucomicrobiae bacterium]|nr:glycerol-3-phosphate 1-O-acyltransferase PlsY [Verrucomicrobiae bacterium]